MAQAKPNADLYEQDFYAWANEQAALLRAGKLAAADIENIAEEIESMGRGEKRELINRLSVLLAHLLKWRFQPERRGHSWIYTIREQRLQIARHMKDNPSLHAKTAEAIADAYETAVLAAAEDSGLVEKTFPQACLFSFEQVVAEDFWPD
jgi:Domain of unknown function DUF29